MNSNQLTLRIGVLATILYIATMGLGMFVMHSIVGGVYGEPSMLGTLVWVEILLSLICIYFVRQYSTWRAVGFGHIQWKHTLWLAPGVLLMAFLQWPSLIPAIGGASPDKMSSFGLIVLTTLFVGFSEELMFRGILLRGALTKTSIMQAILISAGGFSLLHAVNVFGGAPLVAVPFQLVLTFVAGLFFAPVALKVRNLIPLMIFHWVWDTTTLSATLFGVANPTFGFLNAGAGLIMFLILWYLMRKETPASVRC